MNEVHDALLNICNIAYRPEKSATSNIACCELRYGSEVVGGADEIDVRVRLHRSAVSRLVASRRRPV